MTTTQVKPTEEQVRQALRELADGVVEAVSIAGPQGAPAGVLYAAMMAHGFTLDQFNAFTGALVQLGRLRRRGDLFFLGNSSNDVASPHHSAKVEG